MSLDLQGWPFVLLSLFAAGLIAGVLGANVVAIRVFMRERRRHAFSRLGIFSWLLSVSACFSGVLAPAVALVTAVFSLMALAKRKSIEDDPERLGPIFSLPQTAWRSGGAELPARVALFNSLAVLLLSGLIFAAVFFSNAP
ncbi:MAG: hypothetical protein GY822_28785 [Deltaproteobacteria bacterium]|nr:hypothetical protein [Deltaproteobacteria bacterium]